MILEYAPEDQDPRWVWAELQSEGRVRIAKTFHFDRRDFLAEPSDSDFDEIDGFVYLTPKLAHVRASWRCLRL